jgi:flagellar motility protein MotE (MotC chaperone)
MYESREPEFSSALRWRLIVLVCCAATLFLLVWEHQQVQDLAADNGKLAAALGQVQNQLAAVSVKTNALTQPLPRPEAPERPLAMPKRAHVTAMHPAAARRRPVDDPRWKQVEEQISNHQKQLASTREDLAKTRSDLQGTLNSTRDELNGSIARTHEDVVALEKRGERNYYEFSLGKSKKFQRVGPISMSLRKVNFKRKRYNIDLMVDDYQLEKKNVNMFEPVWITVSDRPQPVELVIHSIQKDQVKGYISEPKYRKSELTARTAPSPKPPQPLGPTQPPR